VGEDAGRAFDRSRTKHEGGRRRATVAEAADILGITAEAVRTRIKRGRLDSVKDPPRPGGTVYVLLEADQTRPNIDPTLQGQDRTTGQTRPDAQDELLDELRDRVRYLERVLEEEREARTDERRRHDTLMAQLMQRIPELEPPREARESPETAADEQQGRGPVPDAGGPQEGTQHIPQARPWWQRMFGR